MDYQTTLGVIAVLIGFAGYAVYFRGIFKGEIKPHAFSWLVWAILTTIGFLAQVEGGGGPGAWVTGFTALMSYVLVFIGIGASSRALIKRSDWLYFIASLLAIPPWYLTGDPLWSVVIVTVIDTIAFVPTFRKAYEHPETESLFHASCAAVKFLFGIAALGTFSLTTVLYPASLVLANGAFVLMLYFRRRSA